MQQAEVSEQVLDVGLLKEAQAAADVVGDVAAVEFELNFQGVPVAAIEHGNVVELAILV